MSGTNADIWLCKEFSEYLHKLIYLEFWKSGYIDIQLFIVDSFKKCMDNHLSFGSSVILIFSYLQSILF